MKKIVFTAIAFIAPFLLFGLDADNKIVSATTDSNTDIMLCIVTIVLLLPLYLSTRTFLMVAKTRIEKKKTDTGMLSKTGMLVLFLMTATAGIAQTAEPKKMPEFSDVFPDNPLTVILIIIILLESFLIVYFSYLTNQLMKKSSSQTVPEGGTQVVKKTEEVSSLKNLWNKINSFRPISEESQLDTGHSYDGIRELNNITPPWFTTAFIITIIVAAGYLYTYHVAKSSPMQIEEYEKEMAEAEKEKAKMLAIQGNNVDENTVIMLAGSDITDGQKIFVEKCAACHQAHGGSMAGGVGPNLTDNYWLHGGSIKDVFKTIKYGWVEKGMISWKDQLSAKQIAQVSSFIMSIGGSNPAGAKEPQGEIYSETNGTADTNKDSTRTDSLTVKK